ncbi:hypothetical protein D3C87_1373460 [compost metagenome]
MHVLLVLQQRAVQRRNRGLAVGAAQRLGGNVLGHQQLEPVDQLGRARLLLQPGQVAHLVERVQRGGHQLALDARVVDVHDLLHGVRVGELDVVEEAAAQEGVRQLLLVVRGDDDHRPVPGPDQLARLVDVELHAVQFAQQVVREFDVGLVDLVDQQHHGLVGLESLPEHALDDVVADVVDLVVAELGVAQARHRVVLVQALLGLGGRLDVPLQQRHAQRGRHFLGQHGLAGAGLALDQQRPLQRAGGVDGQFQVIGGNVLGAALEARGRRRIGVGGRGHEATCFRRNGPV